ncbi:hypothetical protein ACROYT_G019060 [Oculina patagonica]
MMAGRTLTEEQKQKKREKERKRQREKRRKRTEEQHEAEIERRREIARNITEEQRKVEQERQRERRRNSTEEQREAQKERRREIRRNSTEEQREAEKERQREIRRNKTEDQRKAERERQRIIRRNSTEEQPSLRGEQQEARRFSECRSQGESYGVDHVAGNVNPVTVTATVVTDTEPTLYSRASVDVKKPVCAVENQYQKDKLFATMVLNDQQAQFQLDSGATVNILPEETFKQLYGEDSVPLLDNADSVDSRIHPQRSPSQGPRQCDQARLARKQASFTARTPRLLPIQRRTHFAEWGYL